jgi:hypothetical protein
MECASNAPHLFSCRATDRINTMTTDILQGNTVKDKGPDYDRSFLIWVFNAWTELRTETLEEVDWQYRIASKSLNLT